jgi:hypothetical protein
MSIIWLFHAKAPAPRLACSAENLEDGATVEQFLKWFPDVTRRQAEAVLEHAAQSLAGV